MTNFALVNKSKFSRLMFELIIMENKFYKIVWEFEITPVGIWTVKIILRDEHVSLSPI